METYGYIMNFRFAVSLSQHAMMLAISDAILVLSTGLCVPFAKAVANGYIKYRWYGVVIQHIWQASVLFVAVRWTFNK
jgi:sterol O-acyltransferase